MTACEPCQVRNEAALSNVSYVPLSAWHFTLSEKPTIFSVEIGMKNA